MSLEKFGSIIVKGENKKKAIERKSPDIKSHIYFIQVKAGEEPLKIGKSMDVENRYGKVKTFMPFDIELLGVMEGGITEERKLHRKFKRHSIKGEWFRSDDEILEFISANTSNKIPQPTGGWSGRWFYEEFCSFYEIQPGKRYEHKEIREMIISYNDRYGDIIASEIVRRWKRSLWVSVIGAVGRPRKVIFI